MNVIKLAWRNLWRNKRRTAITSASILFAVFFAVSMRSFQLGSYDHMIQGAIESFAGFLQIQNPDYQDDPSLENTFECPDSLLQSLAKIPGIKAIVPRVETFALASTGNQTKGILVIGIDPEREHELSNPEHRLVRYRLTKKSVKILDAKKDIPDNVKSQLNDFINHSYSNTGTIAMEFNLDKKKDSKTIEEIAEASIFPGSYFTKNDSGVLVADRLSKFLHLNVGDTLILLGQGYHGATAAGLYPVRGIIKLVHPELDNKLIYMPIKTAQKFANLPNRLTTVAINLTDNSDEGMQMMQDKLESKLDNSKMIVKNWKQFDKVLVQQISSDNNSGKVMLGFLYLIIFFGIFGTILMMIHERFREFGVLVSIGMKKTKLATIIIYEMIFMGFIGVVAGIILSSPIVYFLNKFPIRLTGDMAQTMIDMGFDPIMPTAWFNTYVIWQGLIVALMVVLACILPLRKVYKLKEIEALRA